MRRIRRAVSFGGTTKKSILKERELNRTTSPELGYYPTRTGYRSAANMTTETNLRNSQPEILESSDKNTSFYSSNYSSSNYSSIYSNNAPAISTESKESDSNGWLNAKNYAMVPRMGRRASKEGNSKYYKRDGSRSDNRKDYQDIYKDRKDSKPKCQIEGTRRISVDTGVVITSIPSVPSRKYSREEDYATYDDLLEQSSPPKIAPLSGYLSQNAGKAVVRPIAFKPVVPNKQSSSTTYSSHSPDNYAFEKPHIDDGYASQESRSCSHNGTMRDCYIYETRPESYESNHHRESKPTDCYQVTPSPTDNGAAHYEQLIQEKEKELVILRETMEANEKVIFQMNDEKKISWENQMKELTAEYHRRLRLQQDRAFKAEQELQNQINKLQQDNQIMSIEREQLVSQKERHSHTQEQLQSLRLKNDELSNRLTSVSCDCELLRQQDQEKLTKIQTLEELVTVIKAENMNLNNELDEKRRITKKFERQQDKASPSSDREKQRLEKLLAERDLALQGERDQFIHDRELWEQEKKKVLQYQKQLQSNYIQMCRRNSELESHFPPSKSHNNNIPGEKPMSYRHLKPQEKTNFKAQLEATPESLC